MRNRFFQMRFEFFINLAIQTIPTKHIPDS